MMARSRVNAIMAALCCVVLSGIPSSGAPLQGAAAAAPLNIWLDVPFVQQQKEGCGPASIAMVMQYWQRQQHQAVSEASEVAQILLALPPGAHGVAAADMPRYFQQHGYRAFAYAGDWAEIEHQISKGRPLIAALKPAGSHELHYVVVAGVDDPEEVVVLNDSAQRKLLKEDRSQFEREWRATGNWTLLAVPKEK